MPQVLGLSSWRWNNNLKSIFLLLAFPFLLLGVAWGTFYGAGLICLTPDGYVDPYLLAQLGLRSVLFSEPTSAIPELLPPELASLVVWRYWPIIVGVASLWILIGYFFNNIMIRAATGARPLSRQENPKLYNLLENLCISRGLSMPKLYQIDCPGMNAYASGIDAGSYAITVTRGLVEHLTDAEIEAVLGHELTHIINRDARLLIITIVFAGMLSFIAQMLWRSLRYISYGRNNSRSPGKALFAIQLAGVLMMGVGYILAVILRLALSRRREFLADAGSVELTKNPEALISALQKISGNSEIAHVPAEVQQLFIDNPPSLFGLFDTHPPLEDRLNVLRAVNGLHTKECP